MLYFNTNVGATLSRGPGLPFQGGKAGPGPDRGVCGISRRLPESQRSAEMAGKGTLRPRMTLAGLTGGGFPAQLSWLRGDPETRQRAFVPGLPFIRRCECR